MAHEATSMNNIHKLSWMAGQWYLCRRSTRRVSYTTELSVTVEAIMFFSLSGLVLACGRHSPSSSLF